jgi:symplekin
VLSFCFQLQRKEDPNIAMCPNDHPFISVPALEAEGLKLLESVITLLYTSSYVDLLELALPMLP